MLSANYRTVFLALLTAFALGTPAAAATQIQSSRINLAPGLVKGLTPQLGSGPQIVSLSDTALDRSGYLTLVGSDFGSAQAGSRVLIAGVAATVASWTNEQIEAYVPEDAPFGPVLVTVDTSGGTSNALPLAVTARQANGRVQWRFRTERYIPVQFVARGPDGTVYTSDSSRLYALNPDGGLKWVVEGAGGGRPISFGADGTIYTGGGPGSLVWALNPDGTARWVIPNTAPGLGLLAGPNLGPDGNIYAVQDASSGGGGLGQFSVDTDGNLRFSQVQFFSFVGDNSEITFGDGRFYASWKTNAAAASSVHVFDTDNGDLLWWSADVGVSANGYPVLDPLGRLILTWGQVGLVAVTPLADPDWIATHPGSPNIVLQPAIGNSGTLYAGDWLGLELWALDLAGNTVWTAPNTGHHLHQLEIAPDESMLVAMGVAGFGSSEWVRGFDPTDGSLVWHVQLPAENGVNQFPTGWSPVFTPDSQTVYVASGFVGDVNDYGYVYALDVPFDPALDADADGYADVDDNCPGTPNEDQLDSDGDGTGDVCDSIPDACLDATPLCPGTLTGSTVGATNDGASSCSSNPANKDVWYSYTPSADGPVTVDGCGSAYSYFLSVHTGCPGNIESQIGCALYGCGSAWPKVTFDGVAGETYLIRVNGFNAVEIDYTLTLTGAPCQ